jgi:uncharacterized protein YpmB
VSQAFAGAPEVSVWAVIVVILLPITLATCGLFWRRMDRVEKHEEEKRKEIWDALDKHVAEDHEYHLSAERRFVTVSALAELKKDIDGRFDKLDVKLDRVIDGPHGAD